MSWRPQESGLLSVRFIMQNLLPAQTPLGSNAPEREEDQAKDYAAPVTPVLGFWEWKVDSPLCSRFRHEATVVLPFLLSFTVAHPCVSRCRPSTWLISKWDAPKPNTHSPGVVYTACLPWKENFAGPVEQRVWSRAFSVKQMKPF